MTKEFDPNEFKKLLKKPLKSDMGGEVEQEVSEVITMAVDKFAATENWESASKLIKETLDKKFGAAWHVCIGEGFGFDVAYQVKHMLYLYYGERLAILVYKC